MVFYFNLFKSAGIHPDSAPNGSWNYTHIATSYIPSFSCFITQLNQPCSGPGRDNSTICVKCNFPECAGQFDYYSLKIFAAEQNIRAIAKNITLQILVAGKVKNFL